jgi:hypothetical protein
MAGMPASHSAQNDAATEKKTSNLKAPASVSGMEWQMLPGEDVLQIAHLIFPKDSVARDKLVRAIIRTNPEHFPAGNYRPLPVGAIVYIPDLRMVNVYSQSTRIRKSDIADSSIRRNTFAIPKAIKTDSNNNHPISQTITELERIAEKELLEINRLAKRSELLASQIAQIQSAVLLNTSKADEKPIDIINSSWEEEEKKNISPVLDSTALPAVDEQHVKKSVPQSSEIEHQENSSLPQENTDVSMEIAKFSDMLLLAGGLLILLIIIFVLRNYSKLRDRLVRSSNNSHPSLHETTSRYQYEALLIRHNNKTVNLSKNEPISADQAEARALIQHNNFERELQHLQKNLAANQHDISSWLRLFELLYKSGNKRDFKKNARRFKRIGEFPDIWIQIQNLGNRLEADEPLYFDAQKRKEKFFPDSVNFD